MLGNIQQAFQGIWHHKLRSILTMLGIIIGIAAIITIVSTIKGTNDQIKENLIGSGNNAVVVSLHQGDSQLDLSWQKPEGIRVITEETRRELEKLEGVSLVSLFRPREWSDGVYYKDSSFNGCAMGVDDSYFRIYGYRVCYGRGFLPEDRSARRKVVILDANAASSIFYGENPVGKVLEISGEPFTVIGVVERSVQFRPVIETMEDYYLYADKFAVRTDAPGFTLGAIERPRGKMMDDPTFGTVETFHEDLTLAVPLTARPPGQQSLTLQVDLQGCWSGGI